ncbi:MAG TPA: hypothetical protein VF867_05975 [Arthrobacter sp.]
MAVTKRVRTDLQTEQEIEAFAAMAEKPMTSGPEKPLVTVTEKPLASVPDITEPEPVPSPAAAEAAPEVTGSAPVTPVAPAAPAAPAAKAPATPARKAARAGSTVPVPVVPDWKRRNREPKTSGINLRASPSQLDLLRSASMVEEVSQQKVLERLIWPILEEKYGFKAPE